MQKIILVGVLGVFSFGVLGFSQALAWQEITRGVTEVRAVLIDTDEPRIIYIGAKGRIYKSEDGGENWRNVLSIRGGNQLINYLMFSPEDKKCIFAATGEGLFYSANQGQHWKKVFGGRNYLETDCTSIAILANTIYVGTKQGLFLSYDQGRSWHKAGLGNSDILAIANSLKEANCIYAATSFGVFKTKDSGQNWERIFGRACATKENGDSEETPEDEDLKQANSDIRYISLDPHLGHLYVATTLGIYRSQNKGKTWQLLSDYGLLSQDIKFLLVSEQPGLYAITKSGIFEFKNERWYELSLRLVAEVINALTLDKQGNLYAATNQGLFKTKKEFIERRQENITTSYYKGEPEINEVQQVAIRYAEVEPEKIKLWRKQAAKRALLPKVTVSMDGDNNQTISKSIWGIYSSYNGSGIETAPGRHYIGPDDETRYKNRNWGASLTWELGDLIWNDDQTSIDVRSRLMVQLRNDILDEVTKLYFERVRVKRELDELPIEERKRRFEKELRLQELTASLDGLTDGYFSQKLKKERDGECEKN